MQREGEGHVHARVVPVEAADISDRLQVAWQPAASTVLARAGAGAEPAALPNKRTLSSPPASKSGAGSLRTAYGAASS